MPNRVKVLKTPPAKPAARPRPGRITGATNERRAPLDADKAKAIEEAETVALMTNWALWKVSGGDTAAGVGGSGIISSAYNLEARGRRAAVAIPLINGDAVIVDQAVRALPAELRQVINVHWLQQIEDKRGRLRPWPHANTEQRARACGCQVRTYWRRLGHAHERIRALMRAKKVQAAESARLYRASLKPSETPGK